LNVEFPSCINVKWPSVPFAVSQKVAIELIWLTSSLCQDHGEPSARKIERHGPASCCMTFVNPRPEALDNAEVESACFTGRLIIDMGLVGRPILLREPRGRNGTLAETG
jgi:hypothetical protein